MSTENEIKRLLDYRETLSIRVQELEQEVSDLYKAIEVIDKSVVSHGFRTLGSPSTGLPASSQTAEASTESPDEGISITAKDGTVLGKMVVEGRNLVFIPESIFNFTTDIPPFKSFLLDRVLGNMNGTDKERAGNGEMELEDILEFQVADDEGVLKSIFITNYGGERRLREINSSLRWTFDKMFDKIRKAED